MTFLCGDPNNTTTEGRTRKITEQTDTSFELQWFGQVIRKNTNTDANQQQQCVIVNTEGQKLIRSLPFSPEMI